MEMKSGGRDDFRLFCSSVWWLVLIRGILIVLLGAFMLSRPLATLVVAMTILGAYWLIDGVFILVKSLRGRKAYPGWGMGIFVAVLSIIAGLVVLSRPLAATIFTQVFLVYFLAFMALLFGIVSIVTGIRLRREMDGGWSMILGGIFSVVFAILLLSSPLTTVKLIVWAIGVIALIGGISLIIWAFRIRSLCK
jgi:uncharacterized membrane protein HdeD (DUF308 family)